MLRIPLDLRVIPAGGDGGHFTRGIVSEPPFATRVVPDGTAREVAVELGHQLAALPWHCLETDRASVYDALPEPLMSALEIELRHGMSTLATGESVAGAERFVAGAGRHGK
jgi:enoyl-CoA hydratase